jgi:hypothetical protein
MIGVDPALLEVSHIQFVPGEFALFPWRGLEPKRTVEIEPVLGPKAK